MAQCNSVPQTAQRQKINQNSHLSSDLCTPFVVAQTVLYKDIPYLGLMGRAKGCLMWSIWRSSRQFSPIDVQNLTLKRIFYLRFWSGLSFTPAHAFLAAEREWELSEAREWRPGPGGDLLWGGKPGRRVAPPGSAVGGGRAASADWNWA